MERSNYLEEIRFWETSTLIRDNSDRGEEQGNLRGESDGSPPPLRDSSPDDGGARNEFGSISGNYIYLHHVEPRVKLYMPSSFPTPLRYIDVIRVTSTTLDVMYRQYLTGRTHANFFSWCTSSHVTARVAQGMTSQGMMSLLSLLKIIPSPVMRCGSVPSTPILPMFSSSYTSHTTPATSPALSTGIRFNPCATPLGDGLSGRSAGPIPNTGYEPKFCIDQSSIPKHELRARVRRDDRSFWGS